MSYYGPERNPPQTAERPLPHNIHKARTETNLSQQSGQDIVQVQWRACSNSLQQQVENQE